MRRLLTMVLIGLLLQVNFVLAQVSLSYQAQEALKRQTSNMNEVENELSQQLKEVNAPSNPAMDALIVQFNQMLNGNLDLKKQFEAATLEQQSAFMLQFGIIMPGVAQDQKFAFIMRRLESILNDLKRNNANLEHPDVSSLYARVEQAKQKIKKIKEIDTSNSNQLNKKNSLSDFPEFENHLDQATAFTLEIRDAFIAARELNKIIQNQPQKTEIWLLSQVPDYHLKAFNLGVRNFELYSNQINSWDVKYQPLFSRSQLFQRQWEEVLSAFSQISPALKAEAPSALNALSTHLKHNINVLEAMTQDAVERQFTAMFNRNGGIQQIKGLIKKILMNYPENDFNASDPKSVLTDLKLNAFTLVEEAESILKDRLIADMRMPRNMYGGEDGQLLKEKAIKLLRDRDPNVKIHSISICCDWLYEKREEWLQPFPDTWEKKLIDYRETQITIAIIVDDKYTNIEIIGIRQDFILNRELVEFLGTKKMLTKNLK
ncbi:hypothetical protein N9581_00515 [Amylibacter sp.]|nr:hypothetical protein [Amylibacter sp.]